MTDIILDFEQQARRQAVRYACAQKMFGDDGRILDVDRAVLLTIRKDGSTHVMSKDTFLAMVAKVIEQAKKEGVSYNPDGWKDIFEVWDGKTGKDLSERKEG